MNAPLVNEFNGERYQVRAQRSNNINSRQSPPNQLRFQQIVTSQNNHDQSFRDVRQILDEDEALPIN